MKKITATNEDHQLSHSKLLDSQLLVLSISGLLLTSVTCGCVSKAQADAKARAAFLAGQQQGQMAAVGAHSVWVIGKVKVPLIPWTEDLTLARALILADYLGPGDPTQIVLTRGTASPVYISVKQLMAGYDAPLQEGDRIEIRP